MNERNEREICRHNPKMENLYELESFKGPQQAATVSIP